MNIRTRFKNALVLIGTLFSIGLILALCYSLMVGYAKLTDIPQLATLQWCWFLVPPGIFCAIGIGAWFESNPKELDGTPREIATLFVALLAITLPLVTSTDLYQSYGPLVVHGFRFPILLVGSVFCIFSVILEIINSYTNKPQPLSAKKAEETAG